jgi:NH3-dependent NAD+ synthetase
MEDKIVKSKEEISKMFLDGKEVISSDEQLALHIMHRFNIDRDTIETMPAFEEHLKPLFSQKKEK